MTITADTSIELGWDDDAKDAVVADALIPTLDADSLAIWGNTLDNPGLVQSTIGTLEVCLRAAKSVLEAEAAAFWASCPVGGGEGDVVFVAPSAGEVGFYVGTYVATDDRSHFMAETFKQLHQVYLEQAKTGVA